MFGISRASELGMLKLAITNLDCCHLALGVAALFPYRYTASFYMKTIAEDDTGNVVR